MNQNKRDDIFSISDKIRVLPVVHGSGNYTRQVRQRILSSGCDCLAVALPTEFQTTVDPTADYFNFVVGATLCRPI